MAGVLILPTASSNRLRLACPRSITVATHSYYVPYRAVHAILRCHGGWSACEDHNQNQKENKDLPADLKYRIGLGKIVGIWFHGVY